jgi:hypothetical protein
MNAADRGELRALAARLFERHLIARRVAHHALLDTVSELLGALADHLDESRTKVVLVPEDDEGAANGMQVLLAVWLQVNLERLAKGAPSCSPERFHRIVDIVAATVLEIWAEGEPAS